MLREIERKKFKQIINNFSFPLLLITLTVTCEADRKKKKDDVGRTIEKISTGYAGRKEERQKGGMRNLVSLSSR